MAHRRMMGHTGWLVAFVFIYAFRSGLCDISLIMESTVTGYRRESVVIPCTYTTSDNEDVIRIEWEFNSLPVIYRADTQDHIPISLYRKRAVISKSPSGDVSLTLRRLDTDDRGNFKCKVTGRNRNGKVITQEGVTILKVIRMRPPTEQPKVTTAEDEVTTKVLITTKPDVSTDEGETFIEEVISDEHEEIITTKIPHVVTGASNEDDSAIARTKQAKNFHSSSFPTYSFTTHVMHNNPPAEAIKTGSGIFFYSLIIGLLCIVLVLIVMIVLIARRRKTKSYNYSLPTMNQLAASNNYESDIPVCQYENLPMCSQEYEQLVLKNPEGNDSQCQSSK